MMYNWYLPARLEENAMNLPSGDQVGSSLSDDSDVSLRGSPPSALIEKTAKRLPTLPVYTIRSPFGDHSGEVL